MLTVIPLLADLFGTLIRSEEVWVQALQRTALAGQVQLRRSQITAAVHHVYTGRQKKRDLKKLNPKRMLFLVHELHSIQYTDRKKHNDTLVQEETRLGVWKHKDLTPYQTKNLCRATHLGINRLLFQPPIH